MFFESNLNDTDIINLNFFMCHVSVFKKNYQRSLSYSNYNIENSKIFFFSYLNQFIEELFNNTTNIQYTIDQCSEQTKFIDRFYKLHKKYFNNPKSNQTLEYYIIFKILIGSRHNYTTEIIQFYYNKFHLKELNNNGKLEYKFDTLLYAD